MRYLSLASILLLALLPTTAYPQSTGDAHELIKEVAEVANNTTNWQIEGSISYPEPAGSHLADEQFTLLMREPNEARFEQTGVSTPAIIVCDGANTWIYSPPLHKYRKESSAENKLCPPIVGSWKALPTALDSPAIVGVCGPDPTSQPTGFSLVRGFSEPELSSAGRLTRTLCVDPDRKIVAWERWENRYTTRTYTYSKIDLALDLTPSAFVFSPPPDSILTDLELPTPRPLGTRGMSTAPWITVPRLVSKKEPKYGQESRKAGIQGTAYLYVVIEATGVPSEVLVYRHLSPDLDSEAVKAVRQWRFTPGTNNGQPAAIPVVVEVNFAFR
jgi:TonB family protein